MNDGEIWRLFDAALYGDVKAEETYPHRRPFLAHYTSLEALEKILKSNELWFSNPLFMNDIDEVVFGLHNGTMAFKTNDQIRAALQTSARHESFTRVLDSYMEFYGREHLLDTYVFCLSEHQPGDTDGTLSMWRGYGGNGKGVAIVFDTSKLDPVFGSAFIFAKVTYVTREKQFAWFKHAGSTFASLLANHHIPDDRIYLAALPLFERLKIFALFTKHRGFEEENEWRLAYLRDRHIGDPLKQQFSYVNGPRGVEPKFCFKVEPIDGLTGSNLSLNNLISAILLGPSTSSVLAHRSVARMLEVLGRNELLECVHACQIPFRSN